MLEFGKIHFITIALWYIGVLGPVLGKWGSLWFGTLSILKVCVSVGIYKKFYF